MKKIKIAHVVYSFGAGGIENGIVNIVNKLNAKVFFHVICCLTHSGEFEQRLKGDNFTIFELNKNFGNDLKLPFKLKKIFKEFNVDIVHLRGWPTLIEGIMGSKLAGVKTIIYGFHGKTFEDISATKKKRRKYAEKFAIKFVDQIITLSEHMKNDFCEEMSLGSQKFRIIHNGVNIEQFNQEVNIDEVREEFCINKDDFVIGTVGRLDPVKDYKTLVQAFGLFNKKVCNSKLILVGDGQEKDNLKKAALKAELIDKIIFAGYQNNIHRLLKIMTIYVQTSLYEGFSNTIVEAMAVGLPVIATNVGGNPLLISNDKNGFLINKQNPDLLNEKLLFLEENVSLRSKMSQRNKQLIKDRFSVDKMVSEYESCYKGLLKNEFVKVTDS